MSTMITCCFLALALLGLTLCACAGEPTTLLLWGPERPVTPDLSEMEKSTDRGKALPDRFVSNIVNPTLTVYLPGSGPASAAVVICPGGGYGGLAIDKEGHDIARWLNTLGVAGIVLKYRMPVGHLAQGETPIPLQDARQAIRLVRSKAAAWGLSPNRVGILGFSAGGHLASTAGTHFAAADPASPNPLERFSTRPDFMILVYPVISMADGVTHQGSRKALLGATPDPTLVELYSNEKQVTSQTPPTFLVHARDDGVKVENSLLMAEALRARGIDCTLQLFDKGGHGYGLGINGGEVAAWPLRCEAWLHEGGLLRHAGQ